MSRHQPVPPLAGCLMVALLTAANADAQGRVLDDGTPRLRMGDAAERGATAALPHQPVLEVMFLAAEVNTAEQTLGSRQIGVRRTSTIELNGEAIGRLYPDENPHLVHYAVPSGALRSG